MVFNPDVIAIEILNTLFAFFASIAFVLSVKIYLQWDINATSPLQYRLEKHSFLNATIIKYILLLKIPLFLFFIFTLDNLSNVVRGAMCAAGIVDATEYGMYLFLLKIFNLYLFAFWLVLHYRDINDEKLPYTKIKSLFFSIIFFFLIAEMGIETLMFSEIDVNKIVSCCGTLYSSSATSAISNIFTLPNSLILSFFYGNYILLVLAFFIRQNYLYSFLNVMFVFIALGSLIAFFGTYIYELPTHHCPFCMLQRDYNYIGYFLYTFLFLGTFYGMSVAFRKIKNNYKISLFFLTLYTVLVSYYPFIYYIKNGVWLSS